MAEVETETKGKKRLSTTSLEQDEPANKKRAGTAATGDEEEVAEVEGSADSDWKVEDVRGDHESVEHWELRKQFLVENKDRFPNKNRLICLSQVFANMEFLGCRYPEETMELVHELSLGIVESYREKQKSRLQRTFVKASDAAERKTKARMSLASSFISPQQQPYQPTTPTPKTLITPDNNASSRASFTNSTINTDDLLHEDLRNLILLIFAYNIGENAVAIIHRSCSAANIPINTEFQGTHEDYVCTYQIGKDLVVESAESHASKELAKAECAKFAFEKLQKFCYTFVTKVKVSPNFDGREIAKDEIDSATRILGNASDAAIADSNIGNKLLKLMGWGGGGLGKNEQGIHEAISVDGTVGRSRLGLGNSTKGSFFKKIKELLEQQKRAGFPHDLKFASDFSKDERKDIHMIAKKLALRSKSYGKDEDRYIVVSEKVSRMNLIEETLAEGGETDKYKVIPPGGSMEGLEEYL